MFGMPVLYFAKNSALTYSKRIGMLNNLKLCSERFYRSQYCLENIYPNSSLDICKPVDIKKSDDEFTGFIPINEVDIKYSRSTGPGGQNVNKVNTKVEVRFHVASAKWIPEQVKEKFSKLHHNNITKEGFFVAKSDKTRMQTLNLADCLDKIRCLVREAGRPPPEILPETLALLKKRKEKAAVERLAQKRLKSEWKMSKQTTLDY